MADKNFLTDIIDADLAEGKISEIHTRFPPEPNGYLHIGSAKAIYINWSIANQYGGKLAAVLVGNGPVDIDGLGTADVQVAVGLGREAGMDLADLAFGQIGVDDVGQKVFICHVFSPCQRHKVPIYSIILYNTLFFALLQDGLFKL